MKNSGVIRKIDELGRVVIPIELRKKFDMKEKDLIEIYTDNSGVYLKKYEKNCIFCAKTKNLLKFNGKLICRECLDGLVNIKK